MKKNYARVLPAFLGSMFLLFIASCKKDATVTPSTTEPVNFAKLGLYEQVSGINRRIFMAIPKVGDVTTPNYGLVFDTGSTGMTIDANGIIPASMITSNGFQIAGDSVNVSGITITSQQAIITYGGVDGSVKEYGNLAYAKIVIGDANGNVTTPRIPFFLYYKIVDGNGNQLEPHQADIFGVGPGVSSTSRKIGSPLSYFTLANNVTNGFRLAVLDAAGFETTANYVPALLYVGLTPKDLNSSNFVMHPLIYNAISGYSPNIASTVTYNGQSIAASILFDTGTPSTTIIENAAATVNSAPLAANSTVSITTGQGFSYQYTTTSDFNLTQVQNPNYSKDYRTIFSIDFFMSNEYLLDYTNHRIGLKNN